MIWGNNSNQGIVFIKSIEDLNVEADWKDFEYPFVFANYKVVDKTCNKVIKYFVSQSKAEAKKQKQLAYKKHANCEVVIEELNLLDGITVTLENVMGTLASAEHKRKKDLGSKPLRRDFMTLKNNININGTVKSVIFDKDIDTRNGSMRMTKIEFEDENLNTIPITLWGEMCAGIEEGCKVEIKKAEINIFRERFEGLQVPRYGSIKITFTPVKKVEVLPELPTDGLRIKMTFKDTRQFADFMEHVTPQIRDEDKEYVDFVNGSITLRNPSRYEYGMKLTEFGSIPREPRTIRIPKVKGVMKDNFQTVGVLKTDGPYGTKHTPIVENWEYEVFEDDEKKGISYMDKYSYECAQCHEKYGYRHDAIECSTNHIPYGKMQGEYAKIELTKLEERAKI